jgi:hypothetical protein
MASRASRRRSAARDRRSRRDRIGRHHRAAHPQHQSKEGWRTRSLLEMAEYALLRRRAAVSFCLKAEATQGCRPLALHLGTEAAEAQRVIPVGTHTTAILESRRLHAALDTRTTERPKKTTTGGGGHGISCSSFPAFCLLLPATRFPLPAWGSVQRFRFLFLLPALAWVPVAGRIIRTPPDRLGHTPDFRQARRSYAGRGSSAPTPRDGWRVGGSQSALRTVRRDGRCCNGTSSSPAISA